MGSVLDSFKEIWWHKPRLRKDGENKVDRKATWLDLFYDLFFVAVIAVADQLAVVLLESSQDRLILGQ